MGVGVLGHVVEEDLSSLLVEVEEALGVPREASGKDYVVVQGIPAEAGKVRRDFRGLI